MSLKITWIINIILTESNWTVFGNYYKIDKCIIYGNKYLEGKLLCTKNTTWKKVIGSMYNIRQVTRTISDHEYLSWPLWYDSILQIPKIPKLVNNSITMVADVLDPILVQLRKDELERNTNVTHNFLEYMAIKKRITNLIKIIGEIRYKYGTPQIRNVASSIHISAGVSTNV